MMTGESRLESFSDERMAGELRHASPSRPADPLAVTRAEVAAEAAERGRGGFRS